MFGMGNKGSGYVWIVFLILLFCIIQLYNIFTPVMSTTDQLIGTYMNETNVSSGLYNQSLTTRQNIASVWTYWPLLFIFGLIIWAYISSSKREPDYYQTY